MADFPQFLPPLPAPNVALGAPEPNFFSPIFTGQPLASADPVGTGQAGAQAVAGVLQGLFPQQPQNGPPGFPGLPGAPPPQIPPQQGAGFPTQIGPGLPMQYAPGQAPGGAQGGPPTPFNVNPLNPLAWGQGAGGPVPGGLDPSAGVWNFGGPGGIFGLNPTGLGGGFFDPLFNGPPPAHWGVPQDWPQLPGQGGEPQYFPLPGTTPGSAPGAPGTPGAPTNAYLGGNPYTGGNPFITQFPGSVPGGGSAGGGSRGQVPPGSNYAGGGQVVPGGGTGAPGTGRPGAGNGAAPPLAPLQAPTVAGGAGIAGLDPNALLAAYQGSFNQARQSNQDLYNEIKAGYTNLIGSQQAGYSDLLKNVQNSGNAVLGGINNLGQSQRQDVNDAYAREQAHSLQSLISRGLGNTTVTDSVGRGIESDRNRAQIALEDSLARERADYQTQWLNNTNQAQAAGLQNQAGLTGNMLNWQNTVNLGYPDQSFYASLIGQAGQAQQQQAYLQAQQQMQQNVLQYLQQMNQQQPVPGGGAGYYAPPQGAMR